MGSGAPLISWLAEWAACGFFAAGAVTDLSRREVPNSIPLTLLALFAVYAFAGGSEPTGSLWKNLTIGVALLVGGFALYSTGRFGAGDAKLAAVAGMWVGPAGLSFFLLGLGACAFALSAVALLPFARMQPLRENLPFALAIVPPTVAVMISRVLSQEVRYPLS